MSRLGKVKKGELRRQRILTYQEHNDKFLRDIVAKVMTGKSGSDEADDDERGKILKGMNHDY